MSQTIDREACTEADTDFLAQGCVSPRSQFDVYMADVKKTPLMTSNDLVKTAREAYTHRYALLKTLSEFPPCTRMLVEQFEEHSARKLKLYNFAKGYGDQSVASRDDIYALNQRPNMPKVDSITGVKNDPNAEQRLRSVLLGLAKHWRRFEAASPEIRSQPSGEFRRRLSDGYLYVDLRQHEFEAHCALFEGVTDEFVRISKRLVSSLEPEDQGRFEECGDPADVAPLAACLPFDARQSVRTELVTLHNLIATSGVTLREALHLRARYDEHKSRQAKQVNKIVQANLLLPARETLSVRPPDDRLFDICQEANHGLIKAAYRYEYWKGFAFSTYACHWIRQRIGIERASHLNGVVTIPLTVVNRAIETWRVHTEISVSEGESAVTRARLAAALNCTIQQVEEARNAYRPALNDNDGYSLPWELSDGLSPVAPNAAAGDVAAIDDLHTVIRNALDSLPEPYRQVCKLRFGVGGRGRHTLSAISKKLGLATECVRILEKQGLERLREGEFGCQLQELVEK